MDQVNEVLIRYIYICRIFNDFLKRCDIHYIFNLSIKLIQFSLDFQSVVFVFYTRIYHIPCLKPKLISLFPLQNSLNISFHQRSMVSLRVICNNLSYEFYVSRCKIDWNIEQFCKVKFLNKYMRRKLFEKKELYRRVEITNASNVIYTCTSRRGSIQICLESWIALILGWSFVWASR